MATDIDKTKDVAVTEQGQVGDVEGKDGVNSSASSQHLADGSVLSPQPSTSPDDPLNWSWAKKHAIMLALIPGCMLSDWYVKKDPKQRRTGASWLNDVGR
jgi:hypothetical protein